jgi:PAS domain-containing protein
MLGCAVDDTVGAEQIAALVTEARTSGTRAAVAALIASGTEFDDLVPGNGDRRYALRGRTIPKQAGGHLAVLWLRDDSEAARETAAAHRQAEGFRKLLDAFPFPVWRRQRSLDLDYVNPAYRAAVEAAAETEPKSMPELAAGSVGENGRALAVQAAESRDTQIEAHNIVAAGARRLMELTETPVGDDGAIGSFAIDRTEVQVIRTELVRHIENHEQVLHNLGTAIPIFGADRKLEFYNTAYVKLWEVGEAFLDTKPTMGEILEALREARKIPEQANFPEFKAGQHALFTSLIEPLEELTHLPDGKTLRSVAVPRPPGGLLITWEDVTVSLALERSYNTLIAVIGGDGRLQLSNPAFGRIWQLADDELSATPNISKLIERMRDFLDHGSWDTQKSELINLLTDREGQSGSIERAKGSVVDFATVPLPDGAMLLSYVDVSD